MININGPDKLQWPGQPLDTPAPEVFVAFDHSLADNFWSDQWGKVMSGYSPIKDESGNTVAVLAIDMKADKMNDITHSNFAPLLTFFIFAILDFKFFLNIDKIIDCIIPAMNPAPKD